MAKEKKLVKAITPRDVDFAQWYTDVVREAELCDYSSVKGCLNYLPNGYAIWEMIQADLDRRFKETGVQNVSLPMLIPESLLQKEADHIDGFAPEVAWVTRGGMERLQEKLCIRPTSETFQRFGTNGTLFFVGRRQQDHSFVQESSCGRKDTPFMQHMKKQRKEHSRCFTYTKTVTEKH